MNKGLLNVDEALDQLLAGAHSVAEAETVATLSATGRVLAAAQRSTMNVPPMDNSAMDGYAVRLQDLKGPEPRLTVTQKIHAAPLGRPLVVACTPDGLARVFWCGRRAVRAVCPVVGGDLLQHLPSSPDGGVRHRRGGVSVVGADFLNAAVEAGGDLPMWKIAMKPGRHLA